MEIKNKTILVTGSGSGLGEATARLLKNKGANTILLDCNNAAVQSVAKDINATAYHCDVTSTESVQDAIEKTIAENKFIHGLVNCAGIVHASRLIGKQGAMSLEDFNRVIQVNLVGTFNMMRLVGEKMSVQGAVNADKERGVMINTASVAAFEGQLGQVAYSASKGGIVAMTLPAARELSQFGIRVMSIAPGVMHTPMMASLPEKVQSALTKDIPFPNKAGDPNSFASLVAHIFENSYLNGETIRLDGALRLG